MFLDIRELYMVTTPKFQTKLIFPLLISWIGFNMQYKFSIYIITNYYLHKFFAHFFILVGQSVAQILAHNRKLHQFSNWTIFIQYQFLVSEI